MQDLKEIILNFLNIELPIYYRYIDDIFFVVLEDDTNYILNKFNNYHNMLKFIIEFKKDIALVFLIFY